MSPGKLMRDEEMLRKKYSTSIHCTTRDPKDKEFPEFGFKVVKSYKLPDIQVITNEGKRIRWPKALSCPASWDWKYLWCTRRQATQAPEHCIGMSRPALTLFTALYSKPTCFKGTWIQKTRDRAKKIIKH